MNKIDFSLSKLLVVWLLSFAKGLEFDKVQFLHEQPFFILTGSKIPKTLSTLGLHLDISQNMNFL